MATTFDARQCGAEAQQLSERGRVGADRRLQVVKRRQERLRGNGRHRDARLGGHGGRSGGSTPRVVTLCVLKVSFTGPLRCVSNQILQSCGGGLRFGSFLLNRINYNIDYN
jgi:hypothetical protein